MTRAEALAWADRQVGRCESPPGTNRVFVWEHVREAYGRNYQGSAWCGGFLIDVGLHGGIRLPIGFVSVAEVEAWGRRNDRWGEAPHRIRKGDAVILFGHGVHVEVAVEDGTDAGVWCIGGNTSSSSEWNGGEIRRQFRRASQVHGFVRLGDLYPDPPRPAPFVLPKVVDDRRVPRYLGQRRESPRLAKADRIRNGSENPRARAAVRNVQSGLRVTGHYRGRVDGVFDDALTVAVLAYKREHRLKRTPRVNRKLYRRLRKVAHG